MGCDIHIHSETKQGNAWICDQAEFLVQEDDGYISLAGFPSGDRDYWFFGLLSDGVRTDWPWSFIGKGFPQDASKEVELVYLQMYDDAHSSSYLNRAELKEKLEELKVIRATHLITPKVSQIDLMAVPHLIERLTEYLAKLSAPVPDTDQRIVFWFDN